MGEDRLLALAERRPWAMSGEELVAALDEAHALRLELEALTLRLIRQVDGLDAAVLKRSVRYRRIIGSGEAETRCDHILITLFNHQTHHRGQVHAALTQSGIEPPPLDVIFFLDEHPEVARL